MAIPRPVTRSPRPADLSHREDAEAGRAQAEEHRQDRERAAGDGPPALRGADRPEAARTVRPTKTEAMPAMRLPIAGPLGVAWTSG